jgi:hypothetical protein
MTAIGVFLVAVGVSGLAALTSAAMTLSLISPRLKRIEDRLEDLANRPLPRHNHLHDHRCTPHGNLAHPADTVTG